MQVTSESRKRNIHGIEMVGVSALCLLDYLIAASRHKAVMLTLSTVVCEILRGVYTELPTLVKCYIVELKFLTSLHSDV